MAARREAGDALILAATGRDDGRFLGTTMLFCFASPSAAEVGFWFASWARGRGLAAAGIALTIRWGIEELGLRRIQGLTAPSNGPSQRAMGRAGMTCEGLVEGYDHPQVGPQDVVIYAAQASDAD